MELGEDEFVILKDETCHIVSGAGQSIKILPATLYLTNKRMYVSTPYDKVNKYFMLLNDVSTCIKTETNDCNLLKIVGSNPLHTLSIFIPNPDHQDTFAAILTKLLETLGTGQSQFDALALGLQRRIREAGTIDNFYETYNSIKDNLIKEPPTQAAAKENDQTIQLLSHYQPAPFQFIAVIEDMIRRSEALFFAVICGIVLIFNLIFLYIPFGFFTSFTLFVAILKYGINIIFAKDNTSNKKHNSSAKWRKTFRKIIGTFEKFRVSFDKRLLWKNPKQTLDVEFLLLSVALLFLAFNPAFVLATALFVQ